MTGPEPGLARVGPYLLGRRIGAGGMGAVYLGHHETTGTPAAVKLIRPEHAAVDVFAWAGLVTYAATGQPPFGTGTPAMTAILTEWPRLGDLTEPLRSLVTDAFDKDPTHRPTSTDLVHRLSHTAAEATTRVLAAAGVPPPPTPTPTPQPPPPVHSTPTIHAPQTLHDPGSGSPVPPQHPPPPRPGAGQPGGSGHGRSATVALVASLAALVLVAVTSVTVAAVASGWFSGDDGTPVSQSSGATPDPVGEGVATPSEPPPEFGTELLRLPEFGSTGQIWAVATADVDGTPVAVAGDEDRDVRVWDLTTGEEAVSLAGHPGSDGVEAVATGEVDGIPVAVSGGTDSTVRVWDLTTGTQMYEFTEHTESVRTVAVSEHNGTPVAVSSSSSDDDTVRIWDLTTGQQIGDPFTGHSDGTTFGAGDGVALGELDGSPIAVSGGIDGTVRVWSLANPPGLAE